MDSSDQNLFLPIETQQQLHIIDTSLNYLIILIAAIILSYYSLTVQRQQLILSATGEDLPSCLPNTFHIRLTSSSMVVVSLIFFYLLSDQNARTPQSDPVFNCSNQYNSTASALVLIAAIIRLYDVIFVQHHHTQSDRSSTTV